MNRSRRTRTIAAFTLIELLAVIGIIGVLAALLVPAIKLALQKAEIAQAQNDVKNIEGALRAFYTEYGKWPNPWPVGGGLINDFSYGASIGNYGANHGQGYCENHWLMETLRAIPDGDASTPAACGNGNVNNNNLVNTRGIAFLTVPAKSLKLSVDNSGSLDYVDPWGNPYQITVDTSYDGICSNLAGTVTANPGSSTPVGPGTTGCVTNSIAVWSFGPPGPFGSHAPKDWITSW